jgi:hypothetical protein
MSVTSAQTSHTAELELISGSAPGSFTVSSFSQG